MRESYKKERQRGQKDTAETRETKYMSGDRSRGEEKKRHIQQNRMPKMRKYQQSTFSSKVKERRRGVGLEMCDNG